MLDWLSVVAALGVVLIHVPVYFPAESNWLSFVVNGVCSSSVPLFFVISGYLLARKSREGGWWQVAIKKRMFLLGAPYVFWSAAYVVLGHMMGVDRGDITFANVLGLNLFRLPYFYPFWFLRNLFLLVVISPVLLCIIERQPVVSMMILAIMESLSSVKILHGSSIWIGLFYFTMGMYIGLRLCAVSWLTKRMAYGLLVLSIILFLLGSVLNQSISGIFRSFARVMLVLSAWRLSPDSKPPSVLVGVVFPVYAMHVFVLIGLTFVIKRSVVYVWYGQLMMSLVVFMMCICIRALIKRWCHAALFKCMFGGR